jgi:MoaE-MoaD fusion protein
MQVHVLFFGVLKDLAGQAADSLSLPENAVLGDVLSHYEARIPRLRTLSASLAMSINQEYAAPESKLHAGDEIALLPPVSGGLGDATLDSATERGNCVRIVSERIDTQAFLTKIKRPADGAVVVFEGTVRDNSRGRHTLFLDYEAYEEMALKQMNALIDQALSQFRIREVAIVHRIGRLKIGETSVLIIVASAHRGAAFDACRWLIDTLKRTVPIWKKEYFEDGAVWADGESFPAEIAKGESSRSGKTASK